MTKLFLRILKKIKLLPYLNLNGKVKVNNLTINIPIIKGIGFGNIYGTEPWMVSLFKEIFQIKKDGAYYDVGVNLGQTLIKLRAVNPELEYFGFEPNPICVFYSKELIKANKYKRTSIFPVGVSTEDNIYSLSLFSDDDTDSAASMLDNFRPEQKTFRKEYIPCFNVERILEKYSLPKIGVLKIDVEGAEKEVLESFEKRIKIDRPFIQVEILPVYKQENIERLNRQISIEGLCHRLDYSILRVLKTDKGEFKELQEIKTIGIHSNMDWCEYLLVHNSDKIKFKYTT
ncbi:MAG: FkbM family methyltransferase [Chitinophagaceae bacterium]|jgi:FkbM family methyltransferase